VRVWRWLLLIFLSSWVRAQSGAEPIDPQRGSRDRYGLHADVSTATKAQLTVDLRSGEIEVALVVLDSAGHTLAESG